MRDDFHFKTTFTLHYGTGDDTTEIGMVKIAPRGMTEVDPPTSLPATRWREAASPVSIRGAWTSRRTPPVS
jgi:hypothetical protein